MNRKQHGRGLWQRRDPPRGIQPDSARATAPATRGHHSIAAELGCSPSTLRSWCIQAERDAGIRPNLGSADKAQIRELERKNRERRTANEILRKALAYFAQAELDHPCANDCLHRRAPRSLRSRADLSPAADRFVDLLRTRCRTEFQFPLAPSRLTRIPFRRVAKSLSLTCPVSSLGTHVLLTLRPLR